MMEIASSYWVKMLKALEDNSRRGLNMETAAQAFEICTHYWQQFLDAFREEQLGDPEKAVLFFKQVKPLFTAEIQFYKLLYGGFLFLPDESVWQRTYWSQEIQRIAQFMERHHLFYQYFLSGNTEMDSRYFNHQYCKVTSFNIEKHETYEPNVPYDLLLSLLMAMNRYQKVITESLANMRT